MPDKTINFICKTILQFSGSTIKANRVLTFLDFKEIADEELKIFNIKNNLIANNKNCDVDERDLRSNINLLLYYNVLLMGILPSCPRCGIKNWITLDEIKYNLTCSGCKYDFSISSEQTWYYKMNSLFEMGYSKHGLGPVIMVLGQLMLDARSSFLFTMSLNLYNERDDSIHGDKKIKPFTDLDIVCIVDGEFIIGEVKQTNKLFSKSDFEKMCDVAVRIRPDKVIFSSLSLEPSEFIKTNIEELSQKLAKFQIKVEWYQIYESVFEPSWVR